VEEELIGRSRIGGSRIQISKEVFVKTKKKFGREDKESIKVAELKKMKQGGKIMEEFVQEFRRAARESDYEERALVDKFKRGINKVIRKKLMEVERFPTSIE